MNGMEMMMRSLMKGAGIDPDKVMEQVTELRGVFLSGLHHAEQANRRMARIEAHLGLSDIEPVPTTLVITDAKSEYGEQTGSGNDGG